MSKKKNDFVAGMRSQISTATPNQLQQDIQKTLENQSDKKMRRFSREVLMPFVSAVKEYTDVIDTMVQAWPMPSALIWGGLKIFLNCAYRYQSQFDNIKFQLERIKPILFDLAGREDLYESSPYGFAVIQELLVASYKAIIWFWYRCIKILQHGGRSIFKTDQKLNSLVEDLIEQEARLERRCNIVEARLHKEGRRVVERVEEEFAKLAREIEQERQLTGEERLLNQEERRYAGIERRLMAIERGKAERERAEAQRRRNLEDQQSLLQKLGGDNLFNDEILNDRATYQRHPNTCDWLLREGCFQDWLNPTHTQPIFWLNGKPGTGKSVLCARIVNHIKQLQSTPAVAFQLLTRDAPLTQEQILKNLADQLVRHHIRNFNGLSASLRHYMVLGQNDCGSLEALIESMIGDLPLVYFFLDGLDEIEDADDVRPSVIARKRPVEDMKRIIKFLADRASNQPHKIKLWCSSQTTPLINQYFRDGWTSNVLSLTIQPDHTKDDIDNYLRSNLPTTQEDSEDPTFESPAAVLSQKADGSFLWASFMLQDLYDSEDAEDMFETAMSKLPKSMHAHYENAANEIRKRDVGSKTTPLWK